MTPADSIIHQPVATTEAPTILLTQTIHWEPILQVTNQGTGALHTNRCLVVVVSGGDSQVLVISYYGSPAHGVGMSVTVVKCFPLIHHGYLVLSILVIVEESP